MKKLTIAYFGCIDKRYSRNKTNIDGLMQAGADVREVIVNIPVTPLNASQHLGAVTLLKRVLRKWLIVPEIFRHLADIRQSDIIFVGYPGQFDVPFAWLTAKVFGKALVFDPVILMFNALSNDIGVMKDASLVMKSLQAFEKIVMNLPDLIIASTVEQAKFFTQQVGVPPEKIVTAYLAADDVIYHPATSKTARKDKRFKVVYYGLYTPLHGVPHIIKAAQLTHKNPNIVYQMVGKGQIYPEMRALADQQKLTNIEFYPDMMEDNAMELLQQSDAFLGFMESNSTVLREIPNKVYQGMALGKTVITSDSPAIRSVFTQGENIYVVPPADGKALAKVLTRLEADRPTAHKIARNAYKNFLRHYTPKAIGQVMINEFVTKLQTNLPTVVSFKHL